MLKKIAPFPLRGFLWYQGESDDVRASVYGTVLKRLIECWRNLWDEKLPFLLVALAPFGRWVSATGERFPLLRQQQETISKTVEAVWLASSSDAGMEWDVHPKHKKPIGTRLALLARGHIYGEDILCDPPEFLKAYRQADGIRLLFANADGLHIKGGKINALHLSDNNGNECTADAIEIDGNSVVLKGSFPQQLKISFAWTP
jgi:sialate O-acetylesterase